MLVRDCVFENKITKINETIIRILYVDLESQNCIELQKCFEIFYSAIG